MSCVIADYGLRKRAFRHGFWLQALKELFAIARLSSTHSQPRARLGFHHVLNIPLICADLRVQIAVCESIRRLRVLGS
jgi:hypothetical protein